MEESLAYYGSPPGDARTWTVHQLRDAIRTQRAASLDGNFSAQTRRNAALLANTYNAILEHRLNTPRRGELGNEALNYFTDSAIA